MVFLINTLKVSPEGEASIEGLACGITRLTKNVSFTLTREMDFTVTLV